MSEGSNKKTAKNYARLTTLAMELVVLVILAIVLGKKLDQVFNVSGIATALSIAVAFMIWVVLLVKTLQIIDKDSKS